MSWVPTAAADNDSAGIGGGGWVCVWGSFGGSCGDRDGGGGMW